MTAGESITLRVAQALEDCGIPFLLSGYIEDWCQRLGTLPLMAEIRRSISVS